MFYAGNGRELAAFENRKDRDRFVAEYEYIWGEEKANSSEAMDYPQFGIAKRNPGLAFSDDGSIDRYWTKAVQEMNYPDDAWVLDFA